MVRCLRLHILLLLPLCFCVYGSPVPVNPSNPGAPANDQGDIFSSEDWLWQYYRKATSHPLPLEPFPSFTLPTPTSSSQPSPQDPLHLGVPSSSTVPVSQPDPPAGPFRPPIPLRRSGAVIQYHAEIHDKQDTKCGNCQVKSRDCFKFKPNLTGLDDKPYPPTAITRCLACYVSKSHAGCSLSTEASRGTTRMRRKRKLETVELEESIVPGGLMAIRERPPPPPIKKRREETSDSFPPIPKCRGREKMEFFDLVHFRPKSNLKCGPCRRFGEDCFFFKSNLRDSDGMRYPRKPISRCLVCYANQTRDQCNIKLLEDEEDEHSIVNPKARYS